MKTSKYNSPSWRVYKKVSSTTEIFSLTKNKSFFKIKLFYIKYERKKNKDKLQQSL